MLVRHVLTFAITNGRDTRYGKSVAAGLMNHKQAIAATPKHVQRERGLSLVSTNLPNTVKLLIASLDKTSSALLVKYANRQHGSGSGGGGGAGGSSSPSKVTRAGSNSGMVDSSSLAGVGKIGRGAPGETVDELDLFVDSLGVIVDRLRMRIKARPDKVCVCLERCLLVSCVLFGNLFLFFSLFLCIFYFS